MIEIIITVHFCAASLFYYMGDILVPQDGYSVKYKCMEVVIMGAHAR